MDIRMMLNVFQQFDQMRKREAGRASNSKLTKLMLISNQIRKVTLATRFEASRGTGNVPTWCEFLYDTSYFWTEY